ncbi:hypothetical protein PG995_011490 [Apiospora arundinis]
MVIKPIYEPDLAAPYPPDYDTPPHQGSQDSQYRNAPQSPSFPPREPMIMGFPPSDSTYVFRQPAPAPVPSPYLYSGQSAAQQYPQQPTYADPPRPEPASYSPQPPQSPQPQYPSSQPPQSPQPQYTTPQPAFSPPAEPLYPAQPVPPAPPPYSTYGDVKQKYPSSADPAPGAIPELASDDAERGLMGAMLGGATGAFAGHKVNHGFLGALGGAYAGHKLEDALKDQKKHNSRPSSSNSQQQAPMMMIPPQPMSSGPSPSPSPKPEPSRFGNFSHSSSRISLDRDYDLIAECRTIRGHQKLSSISLNHCLTNMDGHFKWAGKDPGNFGASARNVRLADEGRVLEADLRAKDGTWRLDRIHLDERITNIDGDLQLKN